MANTTMSSPKDAVLQNSFYKTVNYFRSSHRTPRIQDGREVLEKEDHSIKDFEINKMEGTLQHEIKKFNRVKMQK